MLTVITGPTASGKSKLAHSFFEKDKFCCIINGDSQQFYRQLNIGVAKPTSEQILRYHYRLINFLDIGEEFSPYAFQNQLTNWIQAKQDQRYISPSFFSPHSASDKPKKQDSKPNGNKKPADDDNHYGKKSKKKMALVSSPSLYHESIFYTFPKNNTNKKIREKINSLYAKDGLAKVLQRIQLLDPDYYETMDRKNPRRAIRALEVIEQTGLTYTSVRKQKRKKSFPVEEIIILLSREELKNKINKRSDEMMQNGWLEEAEKIYQESSLEQKASIKAIGYKELFLYIEKKLTLKEATQIIKNKTWQLAKRQMTWLKKKIHFFLEHSESHPKDEDFHPITIVVSNQVEDFFSKGKSSKESCFFEQFEIEKLIDLKNCTFTTESGF